MVATLLLTLAASTAGLWYARRERDPLKRACVAYDSGDWNLAARLARESLKTRRSNPIALRLLARSSARIGRDETALAIYDRGLEEKAIEAEDYVLLGRILERRGRRDAAAMAWGKALHADRATPRAIEELVRVHLEGNRRDEAASVAELLCRQRGWEARGLLMLGGIRATLNDTGGAAQSFRRALDLDPSEVDRSREPKQLRKLIARTFLQMGQSTGALAPLQLVLAQGPDSEAWWLLSRAYLQKHDTIAAQAALAHAGSYRADNPLAADPGPFVGEDQCEKCHPAQFRDSLASRHTQSYYRGAQLAALPRPDRPLPDPDVPDVTHEFGLRQGILWETTRTGHEVFDAVIEYAFGTSDRYLTMVTRNTRGEFHIARLSYYNTPEGRGWDRSSLDKIHPSPRLREEFQGEPVSARDGVAKCLYCHTTNARMGRDLTGPESADRGIGCERCHGPGGNHLAAVEAGFSDLAIVNPAAASPQAATMKQCNDCHILGPNSTREGYDSGWIRSQGVGWTLSRCNAESGGEFGCVTCHDPHKSAHAEPTAHYELKCLDCHAPPARDTQTHAQAKRGQTGRSGRPSRSCPVEPEKGCVSCHMPRVRIESLHLDLTDHYIRIDRRKR